MTAAYPARALAIAAGVSVALHASLFVADWSMLVSLEPTDAAPAYQATLVDGPVEPPPAAATPAPAAQPQPRAVASLPTEDVAFLPSLPEMPTEPSLEDPPPVVAMAAPAAPRPLPEMPSFRDDALPSEVSIRYSLSSSFADGEADYTWRREGDRYEITGSARASGFFAVFLEGSIDQRTTGRVTPEGLRPERFLEWRPGAAPEGLAFDWDARTVTQSRGGRDQVAPLEDNTIDWLSLVFQLAHQPPREGGADLRVYTQRRLYTYRLDVVGVEEINLPIGRVQALHVRHGAPGQPDAVDVWLGIDQHYLPVKLRYPVARNRFFIEQTARAISSR